MCQQGCWHRRGVDLVGVSHRSGVDCITVILVHGHMPIPNSFYCPHLRQVFTISYGVNMSVNNRSPKPSLHTPELKCRKIYPGMRLIIFFQIIFKFIYSLTLFKTFLANVTSASSIRRYCLQSSNFSRLTCSLD